MKKIASEQDDLKSILLSLLNIHAEQWTLGRLLSEPAAASVPLWGLFVTEEDGSLHFVSFDQENWFSALKNSANLVGKKSSNGIKVHLSFPFSERVSLEKIKKRRFFSFLQSSFPLYHLQQRGSEKKDIFELEDPSSDFLTALRITNP